MSVLADSRPVWSSGGEMAGGLWEGQPTPELLRLLARFALSFRPPTGFLRDFVVEHSGERRGQLDLKHGGMIPIVDLARWAGMAAGVAGASTRERLRAAEAAGMMDSAEAQTLTEAFGFIFSLRLDHQVEQLRRGSVPDDFIDPKTLNPLARTYLREAFRASRKKTPWTRPETSTRKRTTSRGYAAYHPTGGWTSTQSGTVRDLPSSLGSYELRPGTRCVRV